jgi:hypothetical protein
MAKKFSELRSRMAPEAQARAAARAEAMLASKTDPQLATPQPELAAQMALAESIMQDDYEILRVLAK